MVFIYLLLVMCGLISCNLSVSSCTLGNMKFDDCTELDTDKYMDEEFNVSQSKSIKFLWSLKDYSKVSKAKKLQFAIHVSQCEGKVSLFANSGTKGKFPSPSEENSLQSSNDYADEIMVLDSAYASYFIVVHAEMDSIFKIGVFTVIGISSSYFRVI